MPKLTRRAALASLAAAGVAAALPARAADTAVEIKGMKFNPAEVSVKVGDTVTFTNSDGAPHTGTADDKSFDTGRLSRGNSATVTLTAAGDFPYHCAVHPGMKGVIHVS
jgi:plastocyanin